MWRYPSSDAQVAGPTRIFWNPNTFGAVQGCEGSLGLALVELERSENIDITDLLTNSYLANQYNSVLPFVQLQGLGGAWVDATHDMLLGNGDFSVLPHVPCDDIERALLGAATQEVANFYAFMGVVEDCVPCRTVDVCCEDACCSDILCCDDPTCCEGPCCGSSDPCCDDPDPCCGNPDPCCGNPDPCCDAPCNPACGGDACGDGCFGGPCCDDPCGPDCEDNSAKCDAGCADLPPGCCGDPCCLHPDTCCPPENNSCCDSIDPCVCSEDPCSEFCGPNPCDPACGGDPVCDPACGGDPCAPECNPKPCTSPCADPCDPQCVNCDDENPCTTDSCSGGTCSNDPIDCDDGDACTTDSCSGGVCSNDPIICDDGDACNGVETCDPATGCVNSVDIMLCGSCQECDPATGQCAELQTLLWEEFAAYSTPLDTCPNNAGKRIFPGKTSPTDPNAANRSKVKLVATVAPAVAGVTIYFRTWDVDDPFDQNNSTMPNVGVIDSNTSGPDNRGPEPGVGQWSAVTDTSGKASITVAVSMQPGNNYRGGASCDQTTINATTQTQADTNAPPVDVHFREMLTVWRKLHVETDAMLRPTFAQNSVTGFWNEPRAEGPPQTRIDVQSQDNDDDFDNGHIKLVSTDWEGKDTGVPQPPDLIRLVADFEHSPLDDEVVMWIPLSQFAPRLSGTMVMVDDDISDPTLFAAWLQSGQYGADINDPNPHVGLPDMTHMELAYRVAYIKPQVEGQHTSLNLPFQQNGPLAGFFDKATWTPFLPFRGLPVAVPDYWTSYLLGSFQSVRDADADEEQQVDKGYTSHSGGATSSFYGAAYTGMSAIFHETIDDNGAVPKITVAHEAGHQLGLAHADGGLMNAVNQTTTFTAQSLVKLRQYDGP